MKKKIYSLMARFFCVAMLCTGFAACGSDDDNGPEGPNGPNDTGEVAPGAFAEDATRITIDDIYAPFNELELTAAGRYFMEEWDSPEMPGGYGKATRAGEGTRTGKYTKNANGEYVLDGFGTVIISDDHTVTVVYNGERVSYTYTETPKATTYDCSSLANEWKLDQIYVKASGEGQTIEKTFANWAEFDAFADEEDDDEDWDDEDWAPARKTLRKKANVMRREAEFSYGETRLEQMIVSEFGFIFPMMKWYDLNNNFIREDYGLAFFQWGATGKNRGIVRFANQDDVYWDGMFDRFDMYLSGSRLVLHGEDSEYDEEDGDLEMIMELRYNVMR